MGVMRPDLVMKSTIPVIMAALLGIYGLVMGNFIKSNSQIFHFRHLHIRNHFCFLVTSNVDAYSFHLAYSHLAAGLTVGLSSLASGLAIGIVGDAGVRAIAQQPRLFVGVLLMLIFAEALGLYGTLLITLKS
jgi:V-type H+-transporting ATPase 16kDa proteolipid subunit